MKIWINVYEFKKIGGKFLDENEYRYELHEHLLSGQSIDKSTKIVPTSNQWKYFKQRPDIGIRFDSMTDDELKNESEFHNYQVLADVSLNKIQ